jgi:hypothetical protein
MPVKPVWAVVDTPVAIRTVTYRGEPIGAPYEVYIDQDNAHKWDKA